VLTSRLCTYACRYPGSQGKQYFVGLEAVLGGSGDPAYPGKQEMWGWGGPVGGGRKRLCWAAAVSPHTPVCRKQGAVVNKGEGCGAGAHSVGEGGEAHEGISVHKAGWRGTVACLVCVRRGAERGEAHWKGVQAHTAQTDFGVTPFFRNACGWMRGEEVGSRGSWACVSVEGWGLRAVQPLGKPVQCLVQAAKWCAALAGCCVWVVRFVFRWPTTCRESLTARTVVGSGWYGPCFSG
jgi:hypothetical protein